MYLAIFFLAKLIACEKSVVDDEETENALRVEHRCALSTDKLSN